MDRLKGRGHLGWGLVQKEAAHFCAQWHQQSISQLDVPWGCMGWQPLFIIWVQAHKSGDKAAPALTCSPNKPNLRNKRTGVVGARGGLESCRSCWHSHGHPSFLLPCSLLCSLPSPAAPTGEGLCSPQNPSRGSPGRAGGGQGEPGFVWGILWRVESPRCGEGAREAPALARDPLWVQPMAGGAGPSPTAPAVTLSDELHAIRRC